MPYTGEWHPTWGALSVPLHISEEVAGQRGALMLSMEHGLYLPPTCCMLAVVVVYSSTKACMHQLSWIWTCLLMYMYILCLQH